MSTKLLDETQVGELHQATLEAGLAAQRADLLLMLRLPDDHCFLPPPPPPR